jgi:regulator of protease activity HflC (stomatin/prohibitin superfamily)
LEDARQVPYGSFGGLVWLAVLIVSFTFGLLFYAQFVLPLGGSDGWSEGLRLLWRHYTTEAQQYLNSRFGPQKKPAKKTRKGKQGESEPAKLGLPTGFKKLQAGNLQSHEILALSKANSFIRSAGPGFVMLYKKEQVTHLIDLRTQLRRHPVKASTRDGIQIDTAVTAIFRVRQEQADHPSNEPYSYDKDAIFHICYHLSIDEKNNVRKWTEQLAPRAADLVSNEITRFTLDELYHSGNGGISPIDEIKTNVKQQLQRQMERMGIEVLGIGVSPFTLPEGIVDQRIKSWRAEWERKIVLQRAAGDAEAVRRIKRARARAQIEILENITQNIANVRQMSGADLSQIITLRMIEALEEAKTSPDLQAIIPKQLVANLVEAPSTQMQAWLNPPAEEEET